MFKVLIEVLNRALIPIMMVIILFAGAISFGYGIGRHSANKSCDDYFIQLENQKAEREKYRQNFIEWCKTHKYHCKV